MNVKKFDLQKIKTWLIKYKYIFFIAIPFILIDVFMRIIASGINYHQAKMVFPNILFNVMWIGLFIGIALSLKSKIGKIVYWIFFGLYLLFFVIDGVYYYLTGFFFSFNLVEMADEGSSYIIDSILNSNIWVYIMAIVIIAAAVFLFRFFPKDKEKNNFKSLLIVVAVFILLHILNPIFLGSENKDLEWDTWRNPHNVYDNFNDVNKNMKICGLYEFVFRDFYVTFIKPKDVQDPGDLEYLEQEYAQLTDAPENDMTGIFEGKNVIFLQLEGMDEWLLNETDTPNLYSLMDSSYVFRNHYTYYTGGGSTFNCELAVNTGFITPISFTQNAYTFNKNLFNHSMAKIFKKKGYKVNAFHMNTQEYYSRGINYTNWGYDNYRGLLDENSYDDLSYQLDTELILDKDFYKTMFKSKDPFVHYIITYSPHTPFTTKKSMGKFLAKKHFGEEEVDLSEEESARLFAKETDDMVGLLMQALKDNDLYDNTVIVAYADHYIYTLNDKTIIEKYKNTENNLINHTPFFIWSSGTTRKYVDKVNSQIDVLPTVLNLFGEDYKKEYYIGRDIFDPDYSGYVFFSDYSWYDGNVYVEDGAVTNNGSISEEELAAKNNLINDLIRKNDMTLKYDYFRKMK